MWGLAGESGTGWKQDGRWDLSREQHCNKYEISLFARHYICQNITWLPIWAILMSLIHSYLNRCLMNEILSLLMIWQSRRTPIQQMFLPYPASKCESAIAVVRKICMFTAIQVFSAMFWWFLTWFKYCFWWSSYVSDGADNLGHPSFMVASTVVVIGRLAR